MSTASAIQELRGAASGVAFEAVGAGEVVTGKAPLEGRRNETIVRRASDRPSDASPPGCGRDPCDYLPGSGATITPTTKGS
ncbi:hypothetical protein GCM10017772_22900 [Promicromonospora soli]|uniref:Uncharacterized protein n=1 Tax=Promicromonospora soli TaxID=2035533 RepID=A0A919FUN8_9MICO|nr:hypothetical protein GCM10017772_22900 [Promicromonospora soli]